MMFMPTFSPVHRPKGVTMVAEEVDGSVGYANEVTGSVVGSISGEPLVGYVLASVVYTLDGISILYWVGDAVAALSGKTLYVDSAQYPLDTADIPAAYELDIPGHTVVVWFEAGPTFVDGQSYNIRIS